MKYTLLKIKRVLSLDFPELSIKSIKLHADGWDNIAAEVNSEYIFKFPRDRGSRLDLEVKVLAYMKNKVSLPIPEILFVGKKQECIGYRKLAGEKLTRELLNTLNPEEKRRLVNDIAKFLYKFHSSFALEDAKKMGIEEEDHFSYLNLIKKNISKRIKDKKLIKFIKDSLEEYAAIRKKGEEIRVLYNDLHEDNMAFDVGERKLNGIFDFGDVMIEDVHREFNYLYRLDPVFMKEVICGYEKISDLKIDIERVITYAKINELSDLAEYINDPNSQVYRKTMANIKKWA